MKYLLGLAIAFSLTLVWQTMNLQARDANLKSVEYEETAKIPPQAT